MPRRLPAGLLDALNRPDAQIATHGTLALFVDTGAEIKSYYFATATLNFNGIVWQPQLRKSPEISQSLTSEVDDATAELQNVDTILGNEFASLERFLYGAEADVGRYWKDLDRGTEWHHVFLTGIVQDFPDNENVATLSIVSDVYADISVGPFRHVRRRCQTDYKSPECGRPITDPFNACDKTLNGAGGCDGRWGSTQKFARHMGGPYLDNVILTKIT